MTAAAPPPPPPPPPPPKTRRHKRLRRVLAAVAILALLAIAYFAVTAYLARRDLERAKTQVLQVKQDVLDGTPTSQSTQQTLHAAQHNAHHAATVTAGPLWWAAAHIPWLGRPLHTVRGIAATADRLTTHLLPDVVRAADGLRPDRLRIADNRIDLAALTDAEPALARADTAARTATTQIDDLPHHSWLGPVDDARQQFADLLHGLGGTLTDAHAAADLLPPMLGQDGTRHYLLVFENDAESRGLGGLPGAYALIKATHGAITFEQFGSDADLPTQSHVNLGADFDKTYAGLGPQLLFVNSDLSPHFPDAAQIWMSMWHAKTGQHLDGALATDPTALSYLLAVTGPTTLADGTPITAQDVVALTESTAYQRFANDVPARKAFLNTVAKAAADHIVHSAGGHTRPLVTALGRAVGERRLLAWSAHPAEQQLLARLPIGGILPQTTQPFTAVTIDNAAGSKLDYYLDRTISYQPQACTRTQRQATLTVTLHNGAPDHGLPSYVTTRADNPPGRIVLGSNKLMVSAYETQGGTLTSVTLDGAPTTAVLATERGHPKYTVTLELQPDQTRTIVWHLLEPRVPGRVLTIRQPLVRPLHQTITQPTC